MEKILHMLRQENVAGTSALRAVADFLGRNQVHTASLAEAGGNLPVNIIFVGREEHVVRELRRRIIMNQPAKMWSWCIELSPTAPPGKDSLTPRRMDTRLRWPATRPLFEKRDDPG